MTAKSLGTYLISVLLIGCQAKRTSNQSTLTESDTIEQTSSVAPTTVKADSLEVVTDDSGCVRGQAEPIVRKSVYPNAVFKLNNDNHSGTETVDFENGDRLIIENGGCEYYVLAFRFETSRFQADTTDILFWLDKGIKLVTEVEKGIDSYHVTQGIKGLNDFLKTSKDLTLGEEIVFDDSEIRDFASVDRIQKIADKRYAIEISFATGPL
jgi:hypothetical protein